MLVRQVGAVLPLESLHQPWESVFLIGKCEHRDKVVSPHRRAEEL
jgi:hypothetical protein